MGRGELEEMKKCKWTYCEDGYYDTGCDEAFVFNYDKREKEFKFCPYCGCKIVEIPENIKESVAR